MFGTRSAQKVMWYGGPSQVCQSTAPVAASSPYTQLFSVVAITVLPMTRGCPYTEPLTAVEKIWPNDPPLTVAGARDGSSRSHPVRRSSWEMVTSSPDGPVRVGAPGAVAAARAGPLPATAVSPAAAKAITRKTTNDLRTLSAARARAEITQSPSAFI